MTEQWTPRKLGAMLSLGGTTPMPIGTPEMVADFMEEWFRETDIDGFNLACTSLANTCRFHMIPWADV